MKRTMAGNEPLYAPDSTHGAPPLPSPAGHVTSPLLAAAAQSYKCRRLAVPSGLPNPFDFLPGRTDDERHHASRKCAGTQTLFSSFVPTMSSGLCCGAAPMITDQAPPIEAEPRFILDLDRHMARSNPSSIFNLFALRPPPPPTHLCAPPSAGSSTDLESSNNLPLNLTVPSSTRSSPKLLSQQQQAADDSRDSADAEDARRRSPTNRRLRSTPPHEKSFAWSAARAELPAVVGFGTHSNLPQMAASRPPQTFAAWRSSADRRERPMDSEKFATDGSERFGDGNGERSVDRIGFEGSAESRRAGVTERFLDRESCERFLDRGSCERFLDRCASGERLSDRYERERCSADRHAWERRSGDGHANERLVERNGSGDQSPDSRGIDRFAEHHIGESKYSNYHDTVRPSVQNGSSERPMDHLDRSHHHALERAGDAVSTSRPIAPKGIWSVVNDTRPSSKVGRQENSPRKAAVLTVECDEGVQEHFQRSLGKDYPLCIAKPAPLTQGGIASRPPALPPSTPKGSSAKVNGTVDAKTANNGLTVTGAVDDHFAKSLGAAWTRIKSGNESDSESMRTDAVDDHFAKALGDTWFRLKAEKEWAEPIRSRQGD